MKTPEQLKDAIRNMATAARPFVGKGRIFCVPFPVCIIYRKGKAVKENAGGTQMSTRR